ncbi:replication initiation protein [Pseudomonas monteilii]|jgi:hypothetical protein|uniref:replication initiation protein n=1 Tax=Pseudomonas monteilii TaxID=76759 RepID=UPI0018A5E30E|nr:replication initiation protein [Pseudomonas monteilii]BBW00107.1 hypothetical protein STW0522PSE72_P40050 [Pseudomonas monteilii]
MQKQLTLFSPDRLPYRPYSANFFPGKLLVRTLAKAIKYRYLQLNPPNAVHWVVVDIDKPVIADPISPQMQAIFDGRVPLPNFLAVNDESGRAHAYYALSRPVAKGDHATIKAMRYLAAIESALIFALDGDPTYAGLIAKNPLHKDWRLINLRDEPYTLHELEGSLDLGGPCKAEQREEAKNAGCAGRNVMVFDRLRFHAYQHVQMYREDSNYETWKRYLSGMAAQFNDFKPGLPPNELRHLVHSVAKWTWTRYTGKLSNEEFSQLQAHRGARGGRISAKVRAEKAEQQGTTVSEQMKAVRAQRPTQGKPWEALGISKAQYYRERKNSNEKTSHP